MAGSIDGEAGTETLGRDPLDRALCQGFLPSIEQFGNWR